MKLWPEGQALFSTFAGGEKSDSGNAITLDGDVPVLAGKSDADGFAQRGPGTGHG